MQQLQVAEGNLLAPAVHDGLIRLAVNAEPIAGDIGKGGGELSRDAFRLAQPAPAMSVVQAAGAAVFRAGEVNEDLAFVAELRHVVPAALRLETVAAALAGAIG